MKKVSRFAAQGDVTFRRITALPKGVTLRAADKEEIVAHSETGHHHVAIGAAEMAQSGVILNYLVARGPVTVEHRREWDTHEPLELLYDSDGGEVIWEIRRQRESAPEGWRVVQD